MNEFLFLLHLLAVIAFALGTLRLGKEALSAWVILQVILANLFVIKQVNLFGFTATCSDVFAIGSILGLNLLQEYFGKKSAQKTTWISFYFMLFFALMSQIHLLYIPSSFDSTQAAFSTILSSSPRLFIASLLTFFLVQQVDIRLFSFLKKRMESSLLLRNLLSLFVSQLLDTVLFSLLGLYGLVDSLADIILISFLLKVLILVLLTPITLLSKKIVQPS
jgi:queuosine precursor transporter